MRKDQKYDYNGKGVMQGLLGSDTGRLDSSCKKGVCGILIILELCLINLGSAHLPLTLE